MPYVDCPKCDGTGKVKQRQLNGELLTVDCRYCFGKGKKYVPEKK